MAVSASTPNVQELKQLFMPFSSSYNRLEIPESASFKPASVLIPLFYKDSELHVLLTVRNKNMLSHAGHVAFPGGMWEPGDEDSVATALRETKEEVGIQPDKVEIIAILSPNIVRPNSLVTPVIGVLRNDFTLNINPREVEMVFDLPLKRFLSTEGRTHHNLAFDEGLNFNVYHFKDTINGNEVDTWGFTALQCIQVAMVTFQSDIEICFYSDNKVTKDNCFNTKSTQAIIDNWKSKAKL